MGDGAGQFIGLVLSLPFGMLLAAALIEVYASKRARSRDLTEISLLLLGAACLFALVSVACAAALSYSGKLPSGSVFAAAISAALTATALFFKFRSLKKNGKGAVPVYRGALALGFLSFVVLPFLLNNADKSPREVAGSPKQTPADEPTAEEPAEPAPDPAAVAALSPKEPEPVEVAQPSEPEMSAEPEPVVAAAEPAPVEPAPEPEPVAPEPEPAEPAPVEPTPVVAAAPAEPAAPAVVFAEETPQMYAKLIAPIFKDRCYDCHGADKQKGDLRLDTPEWIRKGGKTGDILVAGVPQDSNIYQLITLEADDPDIMPPKGKPLTERQIAFVRRWILEGAGMDDGEKWAVSSKAAEAAVNTGFGIDAMAASVPAPDAALVKSLEDSGIYVRALSANGALLEIDYSHADLPAGGVKLDSLAAIGPNIYSLDLKRTRIVDADLKSLSSFENLRKLSLQRTGVTDAGLVSIAGLPNLEVINLYNTGIGDQGIKHLEGLKNLKEVYLFETKVSTAGALALRAAIPLAKVDLGAD